MLLETALMSYRKLPTKTHLSEFCSFCNGENEKEAVGFGCLVLSSAGEAVLQTSSAPTPGGSPNSPLFVKLTW